MVAGDIHAHVNSCQKNNSLSFFFVAPQLRQAVALLESLGLSSQAFSEVHETRVKDGPSMVERGST